MVLFSGGLADVVWIGLVFGVGSMFEDWFDKQDGARDEAVGVHLAAQF